MNDRFFTLAVGSRVRWQGQSHEVTQHLGYNQVLITNVATKEVRAVPAEAVQAEKAEPEEASTRPHRDLRDYSEAEMSLAKARFAIIEPLLTNDALTRHDVAVVAKEHEKDAATLYRWIAAYRATRRVTSLVPDRRGPKVGSQRLQEAQERIMTAVIDGCYLTKQRHSVSRIIKLVNQACNGEKIEPPAATTVRRRIDNIPRHVLLTKRGQADRARDRYTLIEEHYDEARRPLDIVQIDHTRADVIVVDEQDRLPLTRPWITVAIDLYSRMVVGFYVSLDAPSSISVGMCLAMAICPKEKYLARLGIEGEWPVWGTMGIVHADNGAEFKGTTLMRSAEEYNIDLQSRPPDAKHFGGHIERAIGTVNKEVHTLPGTTFSNPAQRKGYDSEGSASLTLSQLERVLAVHIVNIYHQEVHSSIDMPPIKKWERGIMGHGSTPGTGLRPKPTDPEKVLLDFLPSVQRTIQRYGVRIDHINYTETFLSTYIHGPDSKKRTKYTFCRDPRNITKCWFLHPESQQWLPLAMLRRDRPAISLAELTATIKRLKADGRKKINEELIYRAYGTIQQEIDSATKQTKAMRRLREKKVREEKKPRTLRMAIPAASASAAETTADEDDPFTDLKPFEYRL